MVKLTPSTDKRSHIIDREFFHDTVRRLFHHRRKHARGVLCGMFRKQLTKAQVDEVLAEEGIGEGGRAEELEVSRLVSLSNRLKNAILRAET